MGTQDPTSKAPTKSQQQHEAEEYELLKPAEQLKENPSVPGTWSPLLTNVCLCTALALSAYVCYRAFLHWWLSFCLLFCSSFSFVAKWTRLANQPALTLTLLCDWLDYLDCSEFRFTCLMLKNAVQKARWLGVAGSQAWIPTQMFDSSSWMLRASVFQVSHPKYL